MHLINKGPRRGPKYSLSPNSIDLSLSEITRQNPQIGELKSPTSSPFFLSAETPPHLVAGSPPASAPRRHGVADGSCQRVPPSREVLETAPLSNAAIRLRRRPSLSCSLRRRCCSRGGSPSRPSIYLSPIPKSVIPHTDETEEQRLLPRLRLLDGRPTAACRHPPLPPSHAFR